MTFWLLLVIAYLLGAIPVGVLAAKARGVDLFSVGSGNVGATNVVRALGGKWGAVVFLADTAKALVPTLIARHLMPHDQVHWIYVGLSATLGHVLSPFLGFRGGKGVSCLLGTFLAASPLTAALCAGVFVLVFLATRYVSVSSIVATASGVPLSVAQGAAPQVVALFGLLTIVTIVLHRKNLGRLLNGTEAKFGKQASVMRTVEAKSPDYEERVDETPSSP